MKNNRLLLLLSVFVVAALVLAACGGEAELGTEENPIKWVLVPSGETADVLSSFDTVAQLIFEETGLVVQPFVATSNAAAIEAMCADPVQAHIGSLATFTYMLASSRGCADAALVSVRFGSASYNGQIFSQTGSGINELADIAGLTFCRADALSTSSWIIPSLELAGAGVDLDELSVVDAGSHDASVTGVYTGDCDAGASFVDARATIEDEFPDVMDVLQVIFITGDIPNDGVQFVPGFDADLRTRIVDALLAIMATEDGVAAMDAAYEWTGLEVHGDEFYDQFRQILDAAGVSPEDL